MQAAGGRAARGQVEGQQTGGQEKIVQQYRLSSPIVWSVRKPYGSPCTLNKSPFNQLMVSKLSSAAAQGFAGPDGTESVQRKQAFRPEPCGALLEPLDTVHAQV